MHFSFLDLTNQQTLLGNLVRLCSLSSFLQLQPFLRVPDRDGETILVAAPFLGGWIRISDLFAEEAGVPNLQDTHHEFQLFVVVPDQCLQ